MYSCLTLLCCCLDSFLTKRQVRLHKFSQISVQLRCRRLSGQFIWTSWMTNALTVWHNQHYVRGVPQPWFLKTRMSEFGLHLSSSSTPWPASTVFVLTLNNRMTQHSQTRKRAAARNLITFLPLVLCEGQTHHISLFVTHWDGSMISHSASAAVAAIDNPDPPPQPPMNPCTVMMIGIGQTSRSANRGWRRLL